MAAVGLDAGAALLAALSILLAIYLPKVLRWCRSFILLRRLPSPKGAGLLAGHAGAYDFKAKHKWEAEVTAALGTVWRRREFWKQVTAMSARCCVQFEFLLLGCQHLALFTNIY